MSVGVNDRVMNALPLPVLTIGASGAVTHANAAAEAFFDMSLRVMQRQKLSDFIPFGSPVMALVEDVRQRGSSVSEHRVDIGSPRLGPERIVDVFATSHGRCGRRRHRDAAGAHHRRQDGPATHPSRRRAVDHGAWGDAGPRDQEPALRNPRRGAIAGAIRQRRGPAAHAAHLRRDRPHREARRAHGAVRRGATLGTGADQRPRRARPCEAPRPVGLCPPHSLRRKLRSRRCRPCSATATSSSRWC